MKRISILFALLLFIGTAFSQSVKTNAPIDGLGNFYWGMNKKQVKNTLKTYTTDKTEISSTKYLISANKIVLAETLFDNGSFYFDDKDLYMIIFTLYANDNNELEKILAILENDYGKQEEKLFDEVTDTEFRWKDNNAELILKKKYISSIKKSIVTLTCKYNKVLEGLYHDYSDSNDDDELKTYLGIRLGLGASTLTNLNRSNVFKEYGTASLRKRFAWDVGLSVEKEINKNFFYLIEGLSSVSGATIDLPVESLDVKFENLQVNNYLGRKFAIGRKHNFFIALGLYIDFNLSFGVNDTKTAEYIEDNFKKSDLGAIAQVGFEYENLQFLINPQMGFLDLTGDNGSKVYNRSLKLAVTYKFRID